VKDRGRKEISAVTLRSFLHSKRRVFCKVLSNFSIGEESFHCAGVTSKLIKLTFPRQREIARINYSIHADNNEDAHLKLVVL
jgi:hypothetical protein